MMRRLFLIAAALIIILSAETVYAKSSLSALGFGLPFEDASVRASGMGLVNLAVQDTVALNLIIPAAWSGPATARFGFMGSYVRTNAKDPGGSDLSDEAGLEGVAMAIPVGDGWFAGFAISPYTRMGYEWISQLESQLGTAGITEEGDGGISQALFAVSLPYKESLRFGISIRTLFGQVERHWRQNYQDVPAASAGISTSERYRGITGGVSLQWRREDGLSAGAMINLPGKISSQIQRLVTSNNSVVSDDLADVTGTDEAPWDIAGGVGKQFGRQWLGLEAAFHAWKQLDDPAEISDNFRNSFRFGAGWEYSPEYRPLDPFWRALTYRAGVYTFDNYIIGNKGHQVRSVVLTSGISFPYFQGRSRIDLALQAGLMGDKDKDGVSEQFIGFKLGINHSELWFVGRRERRDR